jgi:hypothetical protein
MEAKIALALTCSLLLVAAGCAVDRGSPGDEASGDAGETADATAAVGPTTMLRPNALAVMRADGGGLALRLVEAPDGGADGGVGGSEGAADAGRAEEELVFTVTPAREGDVLAAPADRHGQPLDEGAVARLGAFDNEAEEYLLYATAFCQKKLGGAPVKMTDPCLRDAFRDAATQVASSKVRLRAVLASPEAELSRIEQHWRGVWRVRRAEQPATFEGAFGLVAQAERVLLMEPAAIEQCRYDLDRAHEVANYNGFLGAREREQLGRCEDVYDVENVHLASGWLSDGWNSAAERLEVPSSHFTFPWVEPLLYGECKAKERLRRNGMAASLGETCGVRMVGLALSCVCLGDGLARAIGDEDSRAEARLGVAHQRAQKAWQELQRRREEQRRREADLLNAQKNAVPPGVQLPLHGRPLRSW